MVIMKRFLAISLLFWALVVPGQIPFRLLEEMRFSPMTSLQDGLLIYYSMEENGIITRKNALNSAIYIATPANSVPTTVGKIQLASNFVGNSYVMTVGSGFNLATNWAYTINWWSYNGYAYNDAHDRYIMGQYGGSAPEMCILAHSSGVWYLGHSVTGNDMRMTPTLNAANYPQNTWIMYTFSYTNSTYPRFYTNGVLCSVGAKLMTNCPSMAAQFCINGEKTSQTAATQSNAAFDEMGIWLRQISDAEISALYNGGSGAKPPGLTY
jgi:hypothetical protein